jgi:beta-glucosidase
MVPKTSFAFPNRFLWGTATASYQVEGAVEQDGRGPSIWDTFSHKPGNIAEGHTGDIANDQYNRYAEDVALMRDLGVEAYRFSIAWPRIFPEGKGSVNQAGLDYYKRLSDALLESGIKPVATLYHWDLPQALEDAGGWPERDTAQRYLDYANTCFGALDDRVSMWITLNEPFCTAILGYLVGVHAPGIRNRPKAYRAIHHLNLAHGMAVRSYRQSFGTKSIGTTLNMQTPRPATRKADDVLAADRAADLPTRMFLDPLLGKGYPERHLAAYPDVVLPIEDGDMEVIAEPIDFLGVNYYWEHAVVHDPKEQEGYRTTEVYQPETDMGWSVVPLGLFRHLRWLDEHTEGLPLYVTENGCAMPDAVSEDGRVHDPRRVDYLRGHFSAAAAAVQEGVNLQGYFVWSFIDNFEWAFGYTKRFGITYCDYETQKRIPKDSFYYYRDVIAGFESFYPV